MFVSLIDAESFRLIIFRFLEATFRMAKPWETRLSSVWEGKLLYAGPKFFQVIYIGFALFFLAAAIK